jgi:hypothetical protein
MPRRPLIAPTLLLLAASCYGTPRMGHRPDGGDGDGSGGTSGRSGAGPGGVGGSGVSGAGGSGATGGIGGATGSAKGGVSGSDATGSAGTGGSAGSTDTAGTGGAGIGGMVGRGGADGAKAGSGPVGGTGGAVTNAGGTAGVVTNAGGTSGSAGTGLRFLSGPCVVMPAENKLEVFARASDSNIYRRAYDGDKWDTWQALLGLGETTDARSDIDCAANDGATDVHIVATGANPVGALLHAFGTGTTYNRFRREIPNLVFDVGASIVGSAGDYTIGAAAFTNPALYEFDDPLPPKELTPITTQTGSFRSAPDIALMATGGNGTTYFVAFDETGALAIYLRVINSGGEHWESPIKLSPPEGSFAFSPSVCTENGAYGNYSVAIVAVAAGKVWQTKASSFFSPFSSWSPIGGGLASAPDCAIGGPDRMTHVVGLSSTGTVVDIHGQGTSWSTADLSHPL